ncbi:hypothetical protein RirG_262640 [Rhizophagus irregularis DAOM 197198w]|uniref:Uncharacterized protein n=1 Tax=Rhizophagus irregularis (strain DAOM 197198w) TaxID=1432141 RepID=A0A015IBX5_RHIIW|nr:hypothetical protein RirG_262640 [Rhizophagus irregularis DAOM 197198w]
MRVLCDHPDKLNEDTTPVVVSSLNEVKDNKQVQLLIVGNYEEGTIIPLSGTSLTTPLPGNVPATPLSLKQNIFKRPQTLVDIYEMDLD